MSDGEKPADPASNNPVAHSRTTRTGLVLFAIYLLLYGGFMLLNTFAPSTMELLILPGINVAIAYGVGLIVAALLLAVLYVWLCWMIGDDEPGPKREAEE